MFLFAPFTSYFVVLNSKLPTPLRRTFLMLSPTVSPSGSTLAPTIVQAMEGAVQQIQPRVGFTVSVTVTGKEKRVTFHTARTTVAAQITATVT